MIGGWLEHGYCSITVSNHGLIRLIRFGSQICTYLWNFFANRLHLILYTCKILFSRKFFHPKPNADGADAAFPADSSIENKPWRWWRDHLCTKSTRPQDCGTQSSKHPCIRSSEHMKDTVIDVPWVLLNFWYWKKTAINFKDNYTTPLHCSSEGIVLLHWTWR